MKMRITVYLTLVLALAGLVAAAPKAVRIVGGTPAVSGEFPYIASIRYKFVASSGDSPYGDVCVGTIIAENSIVTAAHCVYGIAPHNLEVMVGSIYLSPREDSQQILEVVGVTVHPDYHDYESTSRNDVALIRTRGMIVDGENVLMIAQPPKDHQPQGQCWIAGWGQTESVGFSEVLLKAEIPIVSVDRCQVAYQDLLEPTIQVCAGKLEGGVDACLGDTGGPLICNDVGFPYIAGIVSWGYLCAKPEYPGVYTKVSSYTDWLH